MKATKVTAITTTATAVVAGGGNFTNPASVTIMVPTGGQTVYVGGADVDSTNGFPITAGSPLNIDFIGAPPYVVVSGTTQVVNVLSRY